jgi:sirohydrochlorin ferrochelatase
MRALLLIAHGSRRAEANADLEHVAEQLRQDASYGHVQCSYLELTEPTILSGGQQCVEHGATEVVMVPYFLSPGVHVRDDLTEAKAQLQEQNPTVTFRLAEPLGRHPMLIDVVKERIKEVLTA